jgi:hypothetical protein
MTVLLPLLPEGWHWFIKDEPDSYYDYQFRVGVKGPGLDAEAWCTVVLNENEDIDAQFKEAFKFGASSAWSYPWVAPQPWETKLNEYVQAIKDDSSE